MFPISRAFFLANCKNNLLKLKLKSFVVMEPRINANIYQILNIVYFSPCG